MDELKSITRKTERRTQSPIYDIAGTVPPQAVDIEKCVLGAIMLSEDALFSSIDKLHEGLFYKSEHLAIFAAIKKLVNGCHEVDMLTVVQQLMKDGTLELAGGAYYVSELTNNVVSSAHLEYHIHILAEKFIQREIIRTSTDNIKKAYDATSDALEVLDSAQKCLMEINELSFKRDGLSMDHLMAETQEKMFSDKNKDGYSVMSGFIELDRITSGFQPGTLIILAARPAMGKTACALSMARNIAVQFQKPVAYFSLEMTGVELVVRMLSAEAEIPANKLKRADKLNMYEKDTILKKIQTLRNAPLYIDDTAGLDIFELRAKCRRMKMKYGISMVFIDYMQLMTSSAESARNRNREQEISNISRQLKEMSKELEIPVLAMAQLSRKVEDRPMQIPILADLRESGSIEQDADMVFALRRPWVCGEEQDEEGNSTENLAELRILKHRSGELGIVKLMFEGKYVRFSNLPMQALYNDNNLPR